MGIADKMFEELGYFHDRRYERIGYDNYVELDVYTRHLWCEDNIENIKIGYKYCKTNKTEFDYEELKAILQKMKENVEEYRKTKEYREEEE